MFLANVAAWQAEQAAPVSGAHVQPLNWPEQLNPQLPAPPVS